MNFNVNSDVKISRCVQCGEYVILKINFCGVRCCGYYINIYVVDNVSLNWGFFI